MEKLMDLFGICPYSTSQKLLSGKWALLLLHELLEDEVLRFNELERRLSPITQTTLTKQLRALEEYGVIARKVYGTIPPKVEYSLTQLGKEFAPVMESLGIWGDRCIEEMNAKKEHLAD